ncbi:T9SS type A sorting domain-containing protein [Luteibaculum oceani]|uniref:T9SS type A sorting domain-containing protein n=1 Tax=Luteibaculum oceani TaxID=1294296 RepID=A0A5C6V3W7_9FLAO|nr:T9SS type A sorting domain-containing protein [Luteibaculum oceani]TXC78348.1 T9SS type A sorting domain-containing protein [Luteibaculum oceani]
MKNLILLFCLVIVIPSFGQFNQGFETWDSTYQHSYPEQMDSLFNVPNPKHGTVKKWTEDYNYGVCQTTDSYSGKYAIILHNWYGYANTTIKSSDTISYRPQYLNGHFKYITSTYNGLATGLISVALTKNGNADTIATGSFQFDSTLSYAPFQVELQYLSNEIPDSVHIIITNAYTHCMYNVVCNLLYLDDLSFSGTTSGLKDHLLSDAEIDIYPNPTNTFLNYKSTADIHGISVMDSRGRTINYKPNKENRIDVSALNPGVYFVQFLNSKQQLLSVKRLVITPNG